MLWSGDVHLSYEWQEGATSLIYHIDKLKNKNDRILLIQEGTYFLKLNCYLLRHFSRVRLCETPETAAHQAPPSLGFSRQEHWSGLPFPSPMHESEKWKWSRSVVSDPQRPHGLQPTRLLRPWDLPGKSTGVGCHFLLRKLNYYLWFLNFLYNWHITLY